MPRRDDFDDDPPRRRSYDPRRDEFDDYRPRGRSYKSRGRRDEFDDESPLRRSDEFDAEDETTRLSRRDRGRRKQTTDIQPYLVAGFAFLFLVAMGAVGYFGLKGDRTELDPTKGPLDGGWHTVGPFATANVEIPPGKVQTLSQKMPSGQSLWVGGVERKDAAFTLSILDLPKGQQVDVRSILTQQASELGGRLIETVDVSVGGVPGLEYEMAIVSQNSVRVGRMVAYRDKLYTFQATGKNVHRADPDLRRFLDSFSFVYPPGTEPPVGARTR